MEFDVKQATIDLKITPKEEKVILEMRKPIAERVSALRAKAEAYKIYQQALKTPIESK